MHAPGASDQHSLAWPRSPATSVGLQGPPDSQTQVGASGSLLWASPALSWALATHSTACRWQGTEQGAGQRPEKEAEPERPGGAAGPRPSLPACGLCELRRVHVELRASVCLWCPHHAGCEGHLSPESVHGLDRTGPVWVLNLLPLHQPEPQFPLSAPLSCLPPGVN